MACDILLTLSGPGFLSSVPTWAEVSGNLFSMVCLFLSPFAHCEQLFWFSFFILVFFLYSDASHCQRGSAEISAVSKGVWWSKYRSYNEYVLLQISKKSMSPFLIDAISHSLNKSFGNGGQIIHFWSLSCLALLHDL